MADLEVGRKLDGTDTDVARSIVFCRRGVVTHSREDERRFTVSPSVTTRIEMRGNSRDAPDSVVFSTSQESRDVDEQEPTLLVSHSFHAVQTHSPVPKRIEFKARREHVLVVGLGAVEGINREETDPCQEPLARLPASTRRDDDRAQLVRHFLAEQGARGEVVVGCMGEGRPREDGGEEETGFHVR